MNHSGQQSEKEVKEIAHSLNLKFRKAGCKVYTEDRRGKIHIGLEKQTDFRL